MADALTPADLAEALAIRRARSVIPFAGGTDLMVRRRSWAGTEPDFPEPALFLGDLPELKGVRREEGALVIGAGTTFAEILADPDAPAILKRAAARLASPAIRNAATLGGNICNASPAADSLPPLYVLNAGVVLRSADGVRELPVEDFLTGPGRTDLRPDELLAAVKIPAGEPSVIYYRKVGTRKANALAKVSCAGWARIEGGAVAEARLALGAIAPRVVRSREAEAFLAGRPLNALAGLGEEFVALYAGAIAPLDDQRSSAAYRRTVAERLIGEFLGMLAKG